MSSDRAFVASASHPEIGPYLSALFRDARARPGITAEEVGESDSRKQGGWNRASRQMPAWELEMCLRQRSKRTAARASRADLQLQDGAAECCAATMQKRLIAPAISRRVTSGWMGASGKRFCGSAFRRDSRVVDPRSFRLRNFLAIAFAAVLTAAVLRHVLHVYGGISREDIRSDALLATAIVAVATILFRRVSRRR
jgi:hypothetical protein